MVKSSKIGVALITCDRPSFSQNAIEKWLNDIQDKVVSCIVNDGEDDITGPCPVLNTVKPFSGVACAKNLGLHYLMERGCTHLFLIEDDILPISHPLEIFRAYINTSESTGILHLNFALHGDSNYGPGRTPLKRIVIRYPSQSLLDYQPFIALYPNVLGAFSYYHRKVIEDVGYMDEQFYNALEHVDHTYQIIKAGYHPQFRWFADVDNSHLLIQDIENDHKGSKIRENTEDWMAKFKIALQHFVDKNGFSVAPHLTPGIGEKFVDFQSVQTTIQSIWQKHQTKSE